MKIEKQPRDDHQVTLVVEVEQERMEASKRRAARKLAERGKIPGFRPGKAPYDVIRRYYGDAAITEEALEILVDEIYPDVLKEAEIEPAAPGSLENVDNLEPPRFTFTVPLQPTVDLGDYKSIRLPYEWTAPTEDKVNEAIEDLRRMYGTTETVERAIQEGDYVLLDVVGVKPEAGEDESPLLERYGFAAYVRPTDKEDEWPFPGFARKLIGLEAGEEKTFSHNFPEDFEQEPDLAGQSVEITATIKTVRGATLPDLDDEFAKQVGPFENLDALRGVIRANLEQESKNRYDDEYYIQLVDKIRETATIKYPPQVLDHEAEHVLEDFTRNLADQGYELESYLKMLQRDRDTLMKEDIVPAATRRLERSLIMDKMTEAEKIEMDEPSLNQEFNSTLSDLISGGFDITKAKGGRKGQQEIAQAVAMQSANRLMTRRVLERLKAIATGEAEAHAEQAEGPAGEAAEPAPKAKKAARSKKVEAAAEE
ncbi:MAG: trigger factor [Chloroflexota bacterium]